MMNSKEESGVSVRIFVGVLYHSGLRMHLNQSHSWKQASILPDPKKLIEIQFQNKGYIGQFLNFEKLHLSDLSLLEEELKNSLQSYSGDYPVDSLKIYLIPQLFIA